MTLSLDDVRNKRFRMARKSGYEVLEVDEFVDEIEESFAQLIEENQNLKKQVDSLKAASELDVPPAPGETASTPVATERETPQPQGSQAPEQQPGQTAPAPVVVTTAPEASSAVVRLVQLATEQAERLISEATAEAQRLRSQAATEAESTTTDARRRAEELEAEARANAERLQAQTETRSQQLQRDIDAKRSEMLSRLTAQRDELSSTVRDLRAFEASYRSSLKEHFRQQIATLDSGRAEPSPAPDLPPVADVSSASGQGARADGDPAVEADPTRSETPRLDALLGDQR